MNPRVLIALVVLAASSLAALVLVASASDDEPAITTRGGSFEGALLPEGVRAPELGLEDQDGRPVRMSDLRGSPAVVTFLYSNCDDTCPAQAQQVKGALDELGEDLPALAISVDPENDTAESARVFLAKQRLTGRMRFVLGTREQLEPIWRGYGIQPQLDDLDHTARVVLLDGEGIQRIGFPLSEVTPDRLAHDLRLLGDVR